MTAPLDTYRAILSGQRPDPNAPRPVIAGSVEHAQAMYEAQLAFNADQERERGKRGGTVLRVDGTTRPSARPVKPKKRCAGWGETPCTRTVSAGGTRCKWCAPKHTTLLGLNVSRQYTARPKPPEGGWRCRMPECDRPVKSHGVACRWCASRANEPARAAGRLAKRARASA